MSDFRPTIGTVAWLDLTVENAEEIRDFYAEVVGWEPSPVSMEEGYEDYNMTIPGTPTPVAGICHALGSNADFPAQWLVYVVVEDAAAAAKRCEEMGGEIVIEPRDLEEEGTYCVIRDPAGAVAALYSKG